MERGTAASHIFWRMSIIDKRSPISAIAELLLLGSPVQSLERVKLSIIHSLYMQTGDDETGMQITRRGAYSDQVTLDVFISDNILETVEARDVVTKED